MKQNTSLRRQRFKTYGTASFVGGVLLLACLVVLNAVCALLPAKVTKFDTTGLGISDMSAESDKLVDGLETDVTIYWLCEGDTIDTDIVGHWFDLLLTRYDEASDRIKVERIDTTKETAFLETYGLKQGSFVNHSFIVESEYRYALVEIGEIYRFSNDYINSSMGGEYIITMEELENMRNTVYYYYGEDILGYQTYQYTAANAELASAIDYVSREIIPHGYLLTGFEGAEMAEDLRELLVDMTERLDELDISKVTEIPDDANCLILHSPTADLTEAQAAMLKAYINRGGSLILNTSPATVQNCPNLLSVTAEFGLSALPGMVTDSAQGYYASGTSADVLTPKINTSHDLSLVAQYGYSMQMPASHAIKTADDLSSDIRVTPIYSTSKSAMRVEVGNVGNTLGSAGAMDVAVSAEKLVTTPDGATATAGLAWFGSVDAFNAEYITKSENGNSLYYSFAFDFVSGEFVSPYSTIEPAQLTSDALTVGTVPAVILIAAVVVVIPVLLLVVGIVIWVKRRNRR